MTRDLLYKVGWVLALALTLLRPMAALAVDDSDANRSPAVSKGDAPIDESLRVVIVTATRIPEPIDQIPAAISVVSGAELRARDAQDTASALSLVTGVEAPAGGDAGPSSAVPAFWGLHEFDSFLLVMDDVPWGGAFNPAITSLNLNDVEPIEVP